MKYDVHLSKRAANFLKKTDKRTKARIMEILKRISEGDLRNARKIIGEENLFRVRAGKYRILFEIMKKDCVILVINIDKRSRIYKRTKK